MPIINRQSALRAFDRRTTAEARRLSRRACPIQGCGQPISSQYLMCPRHWARVPVAIQGRVYRAWRSLTAARSPHALDEYRAAKTEAIRFAQPSPTRSADVSAATPNNVP